MAYRVDLVVDQGTDYTNEIEVVDDQGDPIIDLNTYTARGQFRRHYTSNTSYNFVCNTASTNTESKVLIGLTANTTAAIGPGRYVYDIELVSPTGRVSRIIEGVVTLTPEVTR